MYTTIIHPIRKAFGLSMNEYAILDTIYHLSNNMKYGGWCVMSKARIGDVLDLSKQSIHKTIRVLITKGLIMKDEKTRHVRSTDTWNNIIADKENYILALQEDEKTLVTTILSEGKDGLHSMVKNVYSHSKESLLETSGNTNSNNNIDNDVAVHALNQWIIEKCPNVLKLPKQMTSEECEKLIDAYGSTLVAEVLLSMNNFKKLTTSYVEVYRTCINWCKTRLKDGS